MQFDSQGLPKDTGASDHMDSCRSAGLMATFSHPQAPDMRKYLINSEGVRHPVEFPANNPKNFTRDQLMPLAAGLHQQGYNEEVLVLYKAAKARWYRAQDTEADVPGSTKKFPNGADLLSPSHMNHLRICSGQKPLLLGKIWILIDILSNALLPTQNEPNQLMTMCEVAGPFYIKMWRKLNPKLNDQIVSYWAGWRDESEFAQFLIEKFQ